MRLFYIASNEDAKAILKDGFRDDGALFHFNAVEGRYRWALRITSFLFINFLVPQYETILGLQNSLERTAK